VFDSARLPETNVRLRGAAFPPFLGFVLAELALTLQPSLQAREPAAVFWVLAPLVSLGALAGAVLLLRIVITDTIRGRAIGWLLVALVMDYVCARLALAMLFPAW
jgi:hypothetical protein